MSSPGPTPSSTPESDESAVYDLTTPEELRTRKRRRLLAVALALLAVSAAGGWFGARPAGRAVRAWQARRAAKRADALMDADAWRDAETAVQDAMQLRPTEPEAIHAAARFLTLTNHSAEAAEFWRRLESVRPLSPVDQRDFAIAELGIGDFESALAHLHIAWPNGADGTPDDWIVAMQIDVRRRQDADALALARKLIAQPASNERKQLAAAGLLLSSTAAGDQTSGWATLNKIADGGKTPESLEALVAVCRRVASSSQTGALTPWPSIGDLATRLEAHPLATIQHRLFAVDLQIKQTPEQRDELIQKAIGRFKDAEPAELAALAAWLYSKGEYQKVLEIVPESKAVQNRALYLQYLDTLGALSRWHDIEDLITRQRFTLERSMEQMFLARCAEREGQPSAANSHWEAALSASGTNPEKLMAVGAYAQKNGALGPAEVAFRSVIAAEPKNRNACTALLELLQREMRTSALHELLVDMTQQWPDDDAVQNDAAYTGLLLGLDPAAARLTAQSLIRKNPGSIPHHVTLALAELRLGHALTALDALKGINLDTLAAEPRHLAVYAAVLWATSDEAAAKDAAARIPPNSLLPEEAALVASITSSPNPP